MPSYLRPSPQSRAPLSVLLLIALLFAADQLTKLLLVTPEWGWHPRATAWQIGASVFLLALIPLLRFRVARYAAALAIAGGLGNAVSSFNPDGIANPFVMYRDDVQTAFNLADVYVWLAPFALLLTLVIGRKEPA